MDQCVVWHFDKRGEFSVRSTYKVEMESRTVGSRLGHGGDFAWWKKLWGAQVPNKFKIHVWHALFFFFFWPFQLVVTFHTVESKLATSAQCVFMVLRILLRLCGRAKRLERYGKALPFGQF